MSTTARALAIVNKFYPDVTTVKDATKDLMIEVTKRDCNSAKVKNHKDCALAVAATRQFDGAIISMSRAFIIKGEVATRYELEKAAAREVIAFDRGGAFEPGEYELLKIRVTHAIGRSTGGRKKKTNTGERVRYHVTTGVRSRLGAAS